MVSTLSAKSGGVWKGPAADGSINAKSNGQWKSPATAYIKSGGVWKDSGYRGYPNPPQNPRVYGWDFSNVSLVWDAPVAGGAATVSYQVAARDSNGNGLSGVPDYDNVQAPWGNFPVGEDGYYIYYVRSKSAAGLYSAWVTAPLMRAHIGHTEQGYTSLDSFTRYWSSAHLSGYHNKDDPFWVGIPSSVLLQGMHWRNLQMPGSSIVTPFNNRTVNWIIFGTDWGDISGNLGQVNKGNNTDYGFNNQGDGSAWGIVPRGSGWSTTGNTNVMLYTADFWCDGTETYQQNVYHKTRDRVENSYW